MTLTGKRILLIIGGGIAAYKSLDLIRRLRERGVAVRAVMTQAVIIALTIDAAPQSRFGKNFFIDFVSAPQRYLGVVNGNFFVQRGRNLTCQSVFPTGKRAHVYLPHSPCRQCAG